MCEYTNLKVLLFFVLFTFYCFPNFSQEGGITKERTAQINRIVKLLKENNSKELADLIVYPIKRPNPIPDIQSNAEFIYYYPTLFDEEIKNILKKTTFNKSNTIDRYDGFGLLQGLLWLDQDGNITSVNYSSEAELKLMEKLTKKTLSLIHPSVKPWKRNILVCETSKFLIRVDEMENDDLRYVSWSKNSKTISDKPDLILFKGVMERQGTAGGMTYTFKNGDWEYQIDDVWMAESEELTGLFLRLLSKGVEKASWKAEKIKGNMLNEKDVDYD